MLPIRQVALHRSSVRMVLKIKRRSLPQASILQRRPTTGGLRERSKRQQTAECTTVYAISGRAIYDAVSADWAATARADGYWQGNSFARIFNDKPYDQLHGYTNLNLALILTNQDGWQVMGYLKNVLNTTAITGAFLFSD